MARPQPCVIRRMITRNGRTHERVIPCRSEREALRTIRAFRRDLEAAGGTIERAYPCRLSEGHWATRGTQSVIDWIDVPAEAC